MAVIPLTPRSAFADWCGLHAGLFVEHAAVIGLTPAQATAFQTEVADMMQAFAAQNAAKSAAIMATDFANENFTKVKGTASELVKLIKAYAPTAPDPTAVYQAAQILPPAPPTPAPPPAQPTNLRVELDPNTGALILKWKASNPPNTSGTGYIIMRKVQGESEFKYVGMAKKKEFVDQTFIAGPDFVQYTVQGTRGGVGGPVSPVFTVTFGIAPSGQMTAKVTSSRTRGNTAAVNASADGNGNGHTATAKGRMA